MSYITNQALELYTYILRSRLSSQRGIAANIIMPQKALTTTIGRHFGKYLGFFVTKIPDSFAFILFVSNEFDNPGEKLYVFYIRSKYDSIQTEEVTIIKKFAPEFKVVCSNSGIINVPLSCCHSCDLSRFILALEAYIGPELIEKLISVQTLAMDTANTWNRIELDKRTLSCKQVEIPTKIIDTLKRYGIRVSFIDGTDCTKAFDFDVLVVLFGGHCYYLVAVTKNTLCLIINHNTQFKDLQEYQLIKRFINNHTYDYDIIPARILSNKDLKCSVVSIIDIILLSLHARPNVHEYSRLIDTSSFPNFEEFNKKIFENINKVEVVTISSQSTESDVEPIDHQSSQLSSNGHSSQQSVSSQASTASSYILFNIDNEGLFITKKRMSTFVETCLYRYRVDDMSRILEFPFNIVSSMVPRDDPDLKIFWDRSYFQIIAQQVARIWELYGYKVQLLPIIGALDEDVKLDIKSVRFLIQFVLLDGFGLLIVVDLELKEWVVTDPHNHYVKEPSDFKILEEKVKRIISNYGQFTGRIIKMPTHFHTEWSWMHLIMAAYTLSKWFCYNIGLPLEIIYTEQQFRHLMWAIHSRLSETNNSHNSLAHKLHESGLLKNGAFRCHRYVIYPEAAVVKEDQCPFCLIRKVKCMKNHIRLAHAGDATWMVNKRNVYAHNMRLMYPENPSSDDDQ